MPDPPARPDLRALAPLGVALIWGVNIPVMKGAIGQVHPFAFNAIRLTVSVVALGWMARGRGGTRVPWAAVASLALLSGGLYQLLFLGGMGRTSAGHTAVLIGCSPLWTTVLVRLLGVERPRAFAWLGLALALGGTALVVGDGAGDASVGGDLLVLGASMAWSVGTLISQRTLRDQDPIRLAFLVALLALPLHWVVAWPRFTFEQVREAGPRFALAVAYSGVLSTGVAYVLWNLGLVAIGAARTAVFVNLVPVVATLVAWGVLGESVSVEQASGGAAVVLGLLLVQAARRRAA